MNYALGVFNEPQSISNSELRKELAAAATRHTASNAARCKCQHQINSLDKVLAKAIQRTSTKCSQDCSLLAMLCECVIGILHIAHASHNLAVSRED